MTYTALVWELSELSVFDQYHTLFGRECRGHDGDLASDTLFLRLNLLFPLEQPQV